MGLKGVEGLFPLNEALGESEDEPVDEEPKRESPCEPAGLLVLGVGFSVNVLEAKVSLQCEGLDRRLGLSIRVGKAAEPGDERDRPLLLVGVVLGSQAPVACVVASHKALELDHKQRKGFTPCG